MKTGPLITAGARNGKQCRFPPPRSRQSAGRAGAKCRVGSTFQIKE